MFNDISCYSKLEHNSMQSLLKERQKEEEHQCNQSTKDTCR